MIFLKSISEIIAYATSYQFGQLPQTLDISASIPTSRNACTMTKHHKIELPFFQTSYFQKMLFDSFVSCCGPHILTYVNTPTWCAAHAWSHGGCLLWLQCLCRRSSTCAVTGQICHWRERGWGTHNGHVKKHTK